MILESCQLLSTAHRILDDNLDPTLDSILYKATHKNHPSAVWVRQSKENYLWLCNLTIALCDEYTYRYGKIHKCDSEGLIFVFLKNIPKNIPDVPFTEPPQAMPDECRISGDSISAYRNYYINNKQHLASWQGKVNSRNAPEWFHANI
jgi:hypothetical protein